ncbi:hypothetical protein GCM10027347_57720 [Larkinella harenae]
MNRKPRILIADDKAIWRMLITLQLTKAGYHVFTANDGVDALKWINSPDLRPDLVLLDLLMPRLSGMDVLRLLASSPQRPPIILMSAAEQLITRQGVREALPDLFIGKPFTEQVLLAGIQRFLPEQITVSSSVN